MVSSWKKKSEVGKLATRTAARLEFGLEPGYVEVPDKDRTTMMGAETAEDSRYLRRLKQFGKAWDARDIDEFISTMTDDCVYCASVGPEPGTTHVGRDAGCGFRSRPGQ